ncbi:MAG: DUF2975 domain-containing protein [Peptoniphilus sp.]|nr:DUF2975 domain-containing protein [Peptoniphilus sp.]MDY3118922.1 DUF2975 domain-containing protein [Peptoniphilus sp.]
MKRLQTLFIGLALATAMVSVGAFFALIGSIFVKAWVWKDASFGIYLPLLPASLTLWGASGLFLLLALAFGLYTTFLYEKGQLFTEAMTRGLDRVAFCFLATAAGFLLLCIYLVLNVQRITLFFLFFLPAVLFASAALFFFLLSDVTEEGRRLREENDLTI